MAQVARRASLVLVVVALFSTFAAMGGAVFISVTSVNPTSGPTSGGTTVTINGSNFNTGTTTNTTVTFGGNAATIVSLTASQIVVTTPAHTAGAVDVVVSNPTGGTSTLPGGFTFMAPPAGGGETIPTLSPAALAALALMIGVVAFVALKR